MNTCSMATRHPGVQPYVFLLCRRAGSAGQSRTPPPLHTDLRTCHSSVHPPPPRPTSALLGGAPLPRFSLPCPRSGCEGEGAWGKRGWPPGEPQTRGAHRPAGGLGVHMGRPRRDGSWGSLGPTHLGHVPIHTTLEGGAMAKPSVFTPRPVPGARYHALCLCVRLPSFSLTPEEGCSRTSWPAVC